MDKKVLLVADDVEMNRSVIRRFLKRDYEVLEAETGIQALEIIRSRRVDLLLLDIIMPEMNGLELLLQLEQEKDIYRPGILVATSTKEQTERQALSLGADDIVSKPYDPIIIKKRLGNIDAVRELKMNYLQTASEEQKDSGMLFYERWNAQGIKKLQEISHIADILKEAPENSQLVSACAQKLESHVQELSNLMK